MSDQLISWTLSSSQELVASLSSHSFLSTINCYDVAHLSQTTISKSEFNVDMQWEYNGLSSQHVRFIYIELKKKNIS